MSDPPAWMRRSPHVAALAVAVTLTRHVGAIDTETAFTLTLATCAYLCLVIVTGYRRGHLAGGGADA